MCSIKAARTVALASRCFSGKDWLRGVKHSSRARRHMRAQRNLRAMFFYRTTHAPTSCSS